MRITFAVVIFLSCGLQYYIPIDIMGSWVRNKFARTNENMSDGALRIGLVFFTCEHALCTINDLVSADLTISYTLQLFWR